MSENILHEGENMKREAKKTDKEHGALKINMYGTGGMQESLLAVFDRKFIDSALAFSYSEDLAGFRPPISLSPKRPQVPQAAFPGFEHFFQITTLVSHEIGKELLVALSVDAIKEILHITCKKIIQYVKKTPKDTTLPSFRYGLWLDGERVLVTVIMDESSLKYGNVEELITEAVENALSWLLKNGVTHMFVTYRVKNGKVSVIPTLSEEPVE
jgi:hypothetical protein